jgi:hypothetical protein
MLKINKKIGWILEDREIVKSRFPTPPYPPIPRSQSYPEVKILTSTCTLLLVLI